jgi:hypothetical protein
VPLLIGASALVMILLGRPGDAATAAISTAVLIILVKLTPHHAWEQPILRLADTVVGPACRCRRRLAAPGDPPHSVVFPVHGSVTRVISKGPMDGLRCAGRLYLVAVRATRLLPVHDHARRGMAATPRPTLLVAHAAKR